MVENGATDICTSCYSNILFNNQNSGHIIQILLFYIADIDELAVNYGGKIIYAVNCSKLIYVDSLSLQKYVKGEEEKRR